MVPFVLIASFPAGPFQANCYLVAPGEGARCVVIDPGMEAAPGVRQALAQYRLDVAGVIATHGHVDHVHSAASIADEHDVPVWIHPADREMLRNPLVGVSAQMGQMLVDRYGTTDLVPPRHVRDLVDGQAVELAGMSFGVSHAPGHTPGCALLGLDAEQGPLTFSGDVLFAGSIGRTDLPGGSMASMVRTLRDVVLGLEDDRTILPGHGPTTTMARERATNPYLQPATLARLVDESDVS